MRSPTPPPPLSLYSTTTSLYSTTTSLPHRQIPSPSPALLKRVTIDFTIPRSPHPSTKSNTTLPSPTTSLHYHISSSPFFFLLLLWLVETRPPLFVPFPYFDPHFVFPHCCCCCFLSSHVARGGRGSCARTEAGKSRPPPSRIPPCFRGRRPTTTVKISFFLFRIVFLWRVEDTRARTFFPSREGRERTRAGERCADNNKEETPADDPSGSGEQPTYFSVRYRQRHIL